MSKSWKIVLPLAVLAVAVLAAFLLVALRPEVQRRTPTILPPLVRVQEAVPTDMRLDVASQGTVRPRIEATLASQVGGRIVEVAPSFAVGGSFRRGELLLRIEDRDYRLALDQARARVAQAEVRMAREEAEAELARNEWSELHGDRPADPLVRREPQLAEARAELAAARAAVERAELDLARTRVLAPFPGRIREKLADLGQSVAAGTPLARAYSTDAAEILLPVEIDELRFLDLPAGGEIASPPEVRFEARFAGEPRLWRGRVVRTGGAIDPATRMLPLVARVDDPYGEAAREAGAPLPVGLFVEARIAGKAVRDVYVLPRSALRWGGDDANRPGTVFVVAEGRLSERRVEILRLAGDRAIVSRGLESGDLVLVSPLETATDGMEVRTTPSGGAPPTAGEEDVPS